MKKKQLFPLVLLCVLFAMPTTAHAVLFFDMYFQPLPTTIFTTDRVVINGRLSNSASSTENLGVIGGFLQNPPGFDYEIGGFASIPYAPSTNTEVYAFHFGPSQDPLTVFDLQTQFEGANLAPGENFDFVFGSLAPINGVVPVDTYSFYGQLQLFRATPDRPAVGFRSDSLAWATSLAREPIPEPSTILILGFGLLGLVFGPAIRML